MKSGARTIIYSCIALLFMGLFVFCCMKNGAIIPQELIQYGDEDTVTITDLNMLFDVLRLIYPIMAILLVAPLTCMLLRRGCNAIGLIFAVLWSGLVFVMEIFYASDINGNTIGLFNMDFTVEDGNIGWLYLALIVICLFSSVISAVGFGERFDDLISEDYYVSDRLKGILLSIVFSNIIMTVVSFITFIPPVAIALINYGVKGEDIPTILHAFIAEKASISLMIVSGVFGIIASIFIWKYIILGFKFVLSGEILRGSGSSSSSSSGGSESYPGQKSAEKNYEYYKKQSEKMSVERSQKRWEELRKEHPDRF